MHMGYFEENLMVGGRATHREAYVDRTHVSSQNWLQVAVAWFREET